MTLLELYDRLPELIDMFDDADLFVQIGDKRVPFGFLMFGCSDEEVDWTASVCFCDATATQIKPQHAKGEEE